MQTGSEHQVWSRDFGSLEPSKSSTWVETVLLLYVSGKKHREHLFQATLETFNFTFGRTVRRARKRPKTTSNQNWLKYSQTISDLSTKNHLVTNSKSVHLSTVHGQRSSDVTLRKPESISYFCSHFREREIEAQEANSISYKNSD